MPTNPTIQDRMDKLQASHPAAFELLREHEDAIYTDLAEVRHAIKVCDGGLLGAGIGQESLEIVRDALETAQGYIG